MQGTPTPINFAAGVQRDGTRFASDALVDALWCRMRRGRPAKIGGYRRLTDRLAGIPRGMAAFAEGGVLYAHVGSGDRLERALINPITGATSALSSRTPVGFAASPENVWQIDHIFDVVTGDALVVAHATPSASDIDSTVDTTVWLGGATGTGQLTAALELDSPSTPLQVSGGIVALHPYLMAFDSKGRVYWSVPGSPANFYGSGSGDAVITAQKLIAGRRTRGPDGGPSGLLWSMDALIRVSFAGDPVVFSFNEVAQTSVLSPACIVEYDGIHFWPGLDRFQLYNGVVRELPNRRNLDMFLDRVNLAHRGKAFGFANHRFGEIWWCVPLDNSAEPNHAFIFNVATQEWYDTPLPNGGRSCAMSYRGFPRPILGGVQQRAGLGWRLWQHEVGRDEVDGSSIRPIRSYFETPDLSLLKTQQPQNKAVRGITFQADFVQEGDLSVMALGNENPRDAVREAEPRIFRPPPTDAVDQVIPFGDAEHRNLRLRIESNVQGGHYEMGLCFIDIEPTSERMTS